jgi:hypothetical protein
MNENQKFVVAVLGSLACLQTILDTMDQEGTDSVSRSSIKKYMREVKEGLAKDIESLK